MEDADSDSGFDSDGDWYHAGRDQLYGTRTDSTAVGPDGAHRRRFLCEEEKKGGTRWGCLSFVVKDMSQRAWHRVTRSRGSEADRLFCCFAGRGANIRPCGSLFYISFKPNLENRIFQIDTVIIKVYHLLIL